MNCKDCIKFDTCYRCHNFDRFGALVTSVYYEESAEECKEFKNKNNIINLPCKFGDTLYWIQEDEIKEFKVTGYIGLYEDGSYCINGEDYSLDEFGKEVFLSKEEAEKSIEDIEHYDTSTGSLHIINEYGCDWNDGVGTSPVGNFCGECTLICSDTCPLAKEEHRDIMERQI